MRCMPAILGVLAGILSLPVVSSAEAAGRIEWRLENPFRLFKNPAHTDLHRRIFNSLSGGESRLPILAAERALEKHFGGRGWAKEVFNETCYNQNADRYNACADYVLPKTHRIVARLSDGRSFWDFFQPNNPNGSCHWRLVAHDGKEIARKTASCESPVTFDIPYPRGAKLSVSRWSGPAEATLDIKVQDLLIVGMGDSFGAGEGNPDYPVQFDDGRSHDYGAVKLAATGNTIKLGGYPARNGSWKALSGSAFRKQRARWWDRECHRSLYSHQLRAALQLAVENPQRAVTFLNFSCSGAEILRGVMLDTSVHECTPGEKASVPGQISALSRELCQSPIGGSRMPSAIIQRMPELRGLSEQQTRLTRCKTVRRGGVRKPRLKRPIDVVFLSVGGNDVGFTPLVADSILSKSSIYRRVGQRTDFVYGVGQAKKRMDLLAKRIEGLKYALKLFFDLSEDTKVIMTGYPSMGYHADGGSTCSGAKGMEVFPPFRLDAAKLGKAEAFSTEVNGYLADLAGSNWTYVDGFREDFRSHGLCASNGDSPAESLAFPRLRNRSWTPYSPSRFPPYAPRQRWFRTPNDAFLTAHMHAEAVSSFGSNCSGLVSGALKTLARRHWQPFQLFLASTYGGAFHPTAEGQARIADEVVKAARESLRATH